MYVHVWMDVCGREGDQKEEKKFCFFVYLCVCLCVCVCLFVTVELDTSREYSCYCLHEYKSDLILM